MNKYYDILVSEIAGKIDLADAKGRIEERKIEEFMLELRYKESGIMRIFRKGEINRIRSRIITKKKRVEKYYAKADNYRMLFSTIKSIVSKK
jgi:hypothetical protein